MKKQKLSEKIEIFQERAVGLATGKEVTYEQYENTRKELLEEPSLAQRFPQWLKDCRSGSQYWSYIKKSFPTYQQRREFIWESLKPLFEYAERVGVEPTSQKMEETLEICSEDSVHRAWLKCLERRENDPEGAITSARTLFESTCKYILDSVGETYEETDDLPKLYKRTSKVLRLSPDQHNEQIFKQILGGCGSVVEGLGSLRNKYGDAHGKGNTKARPTKRHAELAVNLSGTICSFLISTFEERKAEKDNNSAQKDFAPIS